MDAIKITIHQRPINITIKNPSAVRITIGVPGPRGLPGENGVGDAHYVHSQDAPATVWTVTHNLGKRPSVTIVDSADTVVYGDINHVSANQLTLTFNSAFGGKAYCN